VCVRKASNSFANPKTDDCVKNINSFSCSNQATLESVIHKITSLGSVYTMMRNLADSSIYKFLITHFY